MLFEDHVIGLAANADKCNARPYTPHSNVIKFAKN